MSVDVLTRDQLPVARSVGSDRPRRRSLWPRLAILGVLVVQVVLEFRVPVVSTPFEDEGLYVYMGHRMIQHLLHGTFVSEYPGSYFSGAPGVYPVLAAIGDNIGGIGGARAVSMIFGLGSTVAVNGLGRALYGRLAGVLGAVAFILCGSVIYLSRFATYDAMMMCFVALAAWATVVSVRRNRFIWYPAISVLLVIAFYSKYAAIGYLPVIALLAVAVARPADRLLVLRRTVAMALSAAVLAYFVLALWGDSLRRGIQVTTLSRMVLYREPQAFLVHQINDWIGIWLAVAAVAAVIMWRQWFVSVALLLGAVIGPAQQVRIEESTSLSKHVAFGMVFACPMIGALFARFIQVRYLKLVGIPVVAAVVAVMGISGTRNATDFLTDWPPDTDLVPALAAVVPPNHNLLVLGDSSSPERYALFHTIYPTQWRDTYIFKFGGQEGVLAYKKAIDETAFGIIFEWRSGFYNDQQIDDYLTTGKTPYRLVGDIPRIKRGHHAGDWHIFIPKDVALPAGWGDLHGLILPTAAEAAVYANGPRVPDPFVQPAPRAAGVQPYGGR